MNTYIRQAMIAMALAILVGLITFWLRTNLIKAANNIDCDSGTCVIYHK